MKTEQEIRERIKELDKRLKSTPGDLIRLQNFYTGQITALKYVLEEIEE